MRTVTHSMEDYLKTILVIGKEKPVVRAVDISARMRVTKPSVHRAVQLLREEGYIEVSENNHIRLTEQGLMTAQAVNERHEFFVRLLSAAGVPQETAEDEACRMEHTGAGGQITQQSGCGRDVRPHSLRKRYFFSKKLASASFGSIC